MLNKELLINDLKKLHKRIVNVYKDIFDYKFNNDSYFEKLILDEYKRDLKVTDEEKLEWNEQYFHRSAYTLLNKILFIRICEDKGFMLNDEDKVMGVEVNPSAGQKLSLIGLQKWTNLISNYSLSELVKFAFKDMNKSYNNISLYKEDKYDWLIPNEQEIDLRFHNEELYEKTHYSEFESTLESIIITLDTSKYDFGDTSDNVLGDVYEKFMNRETRKALGQFYTPDFVIEYILNSTVKNVDVVENPFVSILDPSCGSGHFLIMAYDILREKFEENLVILQEKYKDNSYEIRYGDFKKVVTGEHYWTKEYLHYHILKNCIYGADIDPFALQITTINLLLKDLDNFITDEINIIESDSLIRWENDYKWEKLRDDLKTSGLFLELEFIDLYGNKKIINPSFNDAFELVKICEFWNKKYDYVIGNPPYLLCQEGNVPNDKVFYYRNRYESAQYKTDLYHLFLERGLISTNENGYMSFITPNTYLTNVFNDKLRGFLLQFDIKEIRIIPKEVFKDAYVDVAIIKVQKKNLNENNILIKTDSENEVIEHYASQKDFLKNHKYIFNLSANSTHELGEYKELGSLLRVYFGAQTFDKNTFISNIKYNDEWIPCINGKDIQKYYIDQQEETFLHHKPENIKSGGNDSLQLTEKIVVRQIGGPEPICAYDSGEYYSINTLYNLVPKIPNIDLKYILAILNSNYMKDYWLENYSDNKKLFPKIKKHQLEGLPIKFCDSESMERISNLVNEIMINYKTIRRLYNEMQFTSNDVNGIKEEYAKVKLKIELLNAKSEDNIHALNMFVDHLYGVNPNNEKLNNSNDQYKDLFNGDAFIKSYRDIKDYCFDRKLSLVGALTYRNQRVENENLFKIQGFAEDLLNYAKLYILNKSIDILEVNSYCSIKLIGNKLANDNQFSSFITILKEEDITKKSVEVIRKVLNEYSDTFKTYLKNKKQGKTVKRLVKFDTDIYGISNNSDEIHKKFFIDSLEYFTSSSNEKYNGTVFEGIKRTSKKAEESLEILNVLDFNDKEDYIEVLSEKIRKAFD
ncbi:restriction endonuclease [Oceanobacillus picturae]|uniref:site-specific DNA-methyltransferase (adenine-specific) n=1 Tax=Oceanobacillus picturae TaxID=171693 RepID=A0A0U9H7T1_9BACI|nr:TaqI-like C-terminal specificity domain-containing protein [Oceanobacillus picturae]GAQ17849.1 restriction endonuclease [Oceanobacillus picturae]